MLVCADARHMPIRSESVQCVVTSPPYWGLRDYGTAQWEGGEPECDHRSPTMREGRNENRAMLAGSFATNQPQLLLAHRTGCGKCGARRRDSQIGLESTPEAYVAQLVAVFREVHRVLRKDGTVWLNLGDAYASAAVRQPNPRERPELKAGNGISRGCFSWGIRDVSRSCQAQGIIKPKDLVGIPWRVAFALQADGWYLRSDIIWAKPNPMPESVTDRPTKAHEYVFLLAKSERYFYDADAIAEPSIGRWNSAHSAFASRTGTDALLIGNPLHRTRKSPDTHHPDINHNERNRRSVWKVEESHESCETHWCLASPASSVWEVATEPYSGAHFATFPRKLIEPMILAGSRPGDLILDPFVGSGTTVHVARALGRSALGLDLKYFDLSTSRIHGPLFAATINA